MHLLLGNIEGVLIGLLRFLDNGYKMYSISHPNRSNFVTIAVLSGGDLGQISVIVPLHFQIENLRLGITGLWNKVLVKKLLKL